MKQVMSVNIVAEFIEKFNLFTQDLASYLSESGHLKMISMALMLLALILFLALIIIIYVRNIVYFVKNSNPGKELEDSDVEDQDESFEEDQQELERELQKELDLAMASQREKENLLEESIQKSKKEQIKIEKEEKKKEAEKDDKEDRKEHIKEIPLGFDWQKGKLPPAEVENFEKTTSLSYKQSKQELNQLLGLVIDMMGRGVDDLRIAQTLNFKTQGMTDENEILKSIDAVKRFISLCLSGKFAKLENYKNLPKEDQALYHLANGDSSLSLSLMENLMDSEIDKANSYGVEEKKQRKYGEISEYACCFGALAENNDLMLATLAYELAVEMHSSNVTAWSRLGDVYGKTNATAKAVWAYQNVLDFADSEIDAAQIANANKHLSEHLYAEGDSLQAAKIYNASKQYYNSLGINKRLSKQELEIVNIIETNYQNSLPETIQRLLSSGYQNS